MKTEVRVVATLEELNLAAALQFVYRAKEKTQNELFTVALSGGSTAVGMYSRLASDPALYQQLSWDSVHLFWSDERHLPPDHPASNYRIAYERMISKLSLPTANVHRIKGELRSAARAAYEYVRYLRSFFVLKPEQLPRFDLVLLGLGADGHTAALFPGSKALHEQKLVVANWVEAFNIYGITMTTPVLNNATSVIFVVAGENKALIVREVLTGRYQPDRYPAQLIRPRTGRVLWLIDKAAAGLLADYD